MKTICSIIAQKRYKWYHYVSFKAVGVLMRLVKQIVVGALVCCSLLVAYCGFASTPSRTLLQRLHQQAPSLPLPALTASLQAYTYGQQHHDFERQTVAIADMQMPSSQKRLWVFDMQHSQLLYHTYVAHGKTSGALYAKHFSDVVNSDATSLGVYSTGNAYRGEHGLSLRLHGLEQGYNNNAFQRDIVLHSAYYVSQPFLQAHHRLGRSWGCPAVSTKMIKPLVNSLKNGAMLMVYYPDKTWLNHSSFVKV
jgi:hypothetical protein